MPNKVASKSKRRKRETTVRDVVLGRIELTYELDGPEAARKEFDDMRKMYADLTPEWYDIAGEVQAFFLEKRKQAQKEAGEREQRITQIWAEALAKNGIVANQLNLMTGSDAQGVYYLMPPKKGDHES